jgi:ketosteroid isomerase-like protein
VMPAAREQVVRDAWDAYNRGDIEATVAILDPEIVVNSPANMANAGTYHGHEGFLAWMHPTLDLARADARVREPGMPVGDD